MLKISSLEAALVGGFKAQSEVMRHHAEQQGDRALVDRIDENSQTWVLINKARLLKAQAAQTSSFEKRIKLVNRALRYGANFS